MGREQGAVKEKAMHRIEKQNAVTNEIYHVFTRSIAGYKIFNNSSEFLRIKETVRYYQQKDLPMKFSRFKQLQDEMDNADEQRDRRIVAIIAYCIMPTHIHLVLKQLEDKSISIYMNHVLNSYTRYFNTRHNRKGPLWEGRFKKVRVETDEQLLHLTRYIHLNPVTACLTEKPEDWGASSYQEYLNRDLTPERITAFENILDMAPRAYREFVEERKDQQRERARIKDVLFD